MAILRSPSGFRYKAFTDNNAPMSGGKLFTYYAGTLDPVNVMSDISGSFHDNPVILNSRGESKIFLDSEIAYKFRLYNSNDAFQSEDDNITTGSGSGGSGNFILLSSNSAQMVNILLKSEDITDPNNLKISTITDRLGHSEVKNELISSNANPKLDGSEVIKINSNIHNNSLETITNYSKFKSTTTNGLDSVSLIEEMKTDGTEFELYDTLHGKADRYARLSDSFTVTDTPSINLTKTINDIKADLKLSANSGNLISIQADGAFANIGIIDSDSVDLTLTSGNLFAESIGSPAYMNYGIVSWGKASIFSSTILRIESIIIAIPEIVSGSTAKSPFRLKYISLPQTDLTIPSWSSNLAQVYYDSIDNQYKYIMGGFTNNQIDPTKYQLCVVTTNSGASIDGLSYNTKYCVSSADTIRQLLNITGNPKDGLSISGRANLGLNVSSGSFFAMGSSADTNVYGGNNVNVTSHSAISDGSLKFNTAKQNGIIVNDAIVIQTSQYDNAGTMTNMPVNDWQNIRIFGVYENVSPQNPNGLLLIVQYGQSTYATKTLALTAISNESFVPFSPTSKMVLLSILTIQRNETLTSNGAFENTGTWGGLGGGGGGGSDIIGNPYTSARFNSLSSLESIPTCFDVFDANELKIALESSGFRVINLATNILVSSSITVNTNTSSPAQIRGGRLQFSGSTAQLNLIANSDVSIFSEIVITGTSTSTPFGSNSMASLKIRSVNASGNLTLNLPTNSIYEKLSLGSGSVTGGLFSFWENTVAGNPSAPLLQNRDNFDLSLGQGTPSLANGLIMSRVRLPAGGSFSKMTMFASTSLGTSCQVGVYSFNPSTNVATRLSTATIPTGSGFLVGNLSSVVNISANTEIWLAISTPFSGLTAFESITPHSSLYSGNATLFYSNSAISTLPTTVSITSASFPALAMPWLSIQA